MFEQLTKRAKLKKAKKLFIDAVSKDSGWQKLARDDFAFHDGTGQWTSEDKKMLEDSLRPVLTFNLSKSSVDLIMGMNEENKKIFRASPFEPSDAFLCEVLNDLSTFVSESNNFEEEEDGALESSAVCGRGYVGIDFQPDPKRFGEIIMTEVDIPVHEVHYDPASRRYNDASYIVWDRWISQEDFKIRNPNISQKKINTLIEHKFQSELTLDPVTDEGIPVSDSPTDDYEREMDHELDYFDKSRSMIRLIHMEYWEYYKKYFAFDPEAKEFKELPGNPTQEMKDQFFKEFNEEITIETMFDKRVKWLQFIGNEIIFDGLSPLPFDGFSIVPVFAYKDASKKSSNHYGIIRLIKDPQREVNKRWSQALNMLNQQVQPGIYAETDAFVDQAQAEQSMKIPGEITWVNSGAITGGKILERKVPTFPNAPMQMEQFSKDIIKQITGINPDLLGQDSGRQEPGVVVRMRQQQGIVLLKRLFSNFDFMKKELFKRQLSIIMSYMPDKQMMRILGQNDRYEIDPETGIIIDTNSAIVDEETGNIIDYELKAEIRDVRNLEYNIIAEPSNANISKRMLELEALLEMQERIPVPPDQIINKLEIAESEKQKWLKYISDQSEAQQKEEERLKNLEIEFKDREIKVDEQKNLLEFTVDMAKIKQMSEKDEKSMSTKFAALDTQERASILQFVANMATLLANKEKNTNSENSKGGK